MLPSRSYPARDRKEWTLEMEGILRPLLTLKPFSLYAAVRVQRGILRLSCNA